MPASIAGVTDLALLIFADAKDVLFLISFNFHFYPIEPSVDSGKVSLLRDPLGKNGW